VLDHDFPSWAIGRAILYGIYDPAANDGYMVVGTWYEPPAFAVAAIRRWVIARDYQGWRAGGPTGVAAPTWRRHRLSDPHSTRRRFARR
jgi:hypothetical protein